jgi:hypothetical protein
MVLSRVFAMLGRMGSRRLRRAVLAAAGPTLLAAGCGGGSPVTAPSSTPATTTASAAALAPVHGRYVPRIDPSDFVSTIDSRYFPLRPGTGYHFTGVRGSAPQTDDMVVTHATKRILGVDCTVVRDTVSERGVPIERTYDWYAQDTHGNVWYMGERSLERSGAGPFKLAGDSWESGVKGARPGIIVPGHPRPGEAYRQEYYPPGQALDEAHVIALDGHVTVPTGRYRHVLVTSEYSPLEPQTEQKYYVAGLGEVAERVVKGHHEAFQLRRVTHG